MRELNWPDEKYIGEEERQATRQTTKQMRIKTVEKRIKKVFKENPTKVRGGINKLPRNKIGKTLMKNGHRDW